MEIFGSHSLKVATLCNASRLALFFCFVNQSLSFSLLGKLRCHPLSIQIGILRIWE